MQALHAPTGERGPFGSNRVGDRLAGEGHLLEDPLFNLQDFRLGNELSSHLLERLEEF